MPTVRSIAVGSHPALHCLQDAYEGQAMTDFKALHDRLYNGGMEAVGPKELLDALLAAETMREDKAELEEAVNYLVSGRSQLEELVDLLKTRAEQAEADRDSLLAAIREWKEADDTHLALVERFMWSEPDEEGDKAMEQAGLAMKRAESNLRSLVTIP